MRLFQQAGLHIFLPLPAPLPKTQWSGFNNSKIPGHYEKGAKKQHQPDENLQHDDNSQHRRDPCIAEQDARLSS
jgi:hypothetical protein